jgi:general secretion pathway protein F
LTFLFMVVVPRFSEMIGDGRDKIDTLSRVILDIGSVVQAEPWATLCGLGALATIAVWSVTNARARASLLRGLSRWPFVGERIVAAQRAEWARIMAFAISTGVGILEASSFAFDAVPAGPFRERLNGSVRALRRGDPIAEAFGVSGALDAIDMSLLRTGQKSGTIGAMFTVIADRHEDDVRAGMKQLNTILEQLAIGIVALAIGAVVIGLVGAMMSIYETVG